MKTRINTNVPETSPIESTGDQQRGIMRWAMQMIAALVIFGAILFITAGRVTWTAGWIYLGLNAFTQVLSAIVLIRPQGEMLAERSQVRTGTKGWDRILAPAIGIVGTFLVLVTAGLDARFGWSHALPAGLWITGIIIAFISQMFVLWAMRSNPFFALTVRIQNEREHNVIRNGPYQVVRHPGYAGSVIYNLVVPLVLGSLWTYLPVFLIIVLLFIRTGLEDQTLQKELPGYQEYAASVHYRLIPGIW